MKWLCICGLAPVAAFAQMQCVTYPAKGATVVSFTMAYPGDPVCAPFSNVNNLAWSSTSLGTASCPTTFNTQTLTWGFGLTYFSDSFAMSSGAGCWNGYGPELFTKGVVSCSISGDVCQQVMVTTLGQFVTIAPPYGVWYAGVIYYYGKTYCYPATASYTLCACVKPAPPPTITCPCNQTPVYNSQTCSWQCGTVSPILLDVDGGGYHLTNVKDGVNFDFSGVDRKIHVSWTAARSTNAWLALDRNHNGTIDNAEELFGNLTDQPAGPDRNGFRALAVFDSNQDGVVDSRDAIFKDLRLWQDLNHDGVSQPDELHPLPELGVTGIDLAYKTAYYVDAHGNRFRYKARVYGSVPHTAYDVFLRTLAPGANPDLAPFPGCP